MSDQLAEFLDHDVASYEPPRVSFPHDASAEPRGTGVRVVIGVSSPALLFGLESVVRGTAGLVLCATAHSIDQLLERCREAGECVALVDPVLCADDLPQFMRVVRTQYACMRVVLISDACQPHVVREAVKCGAWGFVEKTAEAGEIRSALTAAARGQRYLGSNVTTGLAESLTLQDLTARETEVLRLLARGECNKVIARELAVTLGTVKTHVRAILGKLDSRSRTDAVLKACRLGLVRIA